MKSAPQAKRVQEAPPNNKDTDKKISLLDKLILKFNFESYKFIIPNTINQLRNFKKEILLVSTLCKQIEASHFLMMRRFSFPIIFSFVSMLAVLISVISIYLIPFGLLFIALSVILRFRLRVYFTQKFFQETEQIIEGLEALERLNIKVVSSIQAASLSGRIISQKLTLVISENIGSDVERPSLRLDTLDSKRAMLSEQDEPIENFDDEKNIHSTIYSKKLGVNDNNGRNQTRTTIERTKSSKFGSHLRNKNDIDQINSITAFD